ncbi:rhodanese-like domain-containing protein [Fluviispira sanaruensis]|uniref:Molybdopterin-synthase sulfurylase n=1 Tax=Fluviispira sanaruensis TaxID=2493639 RepID=A0A4P2VTT2_FLUSA|nr:rhodanese-like domain-containing protein [Fluviispira sanaruensis]BBH52292.1 molybdopterin-synthase sulfurylase [Fluviispira sanaruensis]
MENQFTQQTTMQEVETHYPFARSLLHSKFHVGGCASCGYEANETIEQVSQKHKKDGSAMLEALNQGWLDMQKAEITVDQFAEMKMRKAKMLIIDVREDWEYELANIPNSYLLTETNFEETVESAKKVECVIVVCHHGLRSMNATLYLRENGVTNARSLQGGIDLYSSKIDPSIPRY